MDQSALHFFNLYLESKGQREHKYDNCFEAPRLGKTLFQEELKPVTGDLNEI